MRTITDDYNALLKRATQEIKALTKQKFELQDQCEKLMSVNEELVNDLAKVMKNEVR